MNFSHFPKYFNFSKFKLISPVYVTVTKIPVYNFTETVYRLSLNAFYKIVTSWTYFNQLLHAVTTRSAPFEK